MLDMPITEAYSRISRVALGDLAHRSALRFGERTAVEPVQARPYRIS
ncbi:MAG TPA: hypothetical protein PKB14_19730 [Rubrivivax sp.]|nr:hypothetical protein [Rubrivivax sp.]